MKVFLSWSGNRSRLVAELLRDWIRCVIQAARPWISTRDLDRGSVWFAEINEQLRDTAIGIICLTGDNKDKPWILFEAGALAKGLNSNRVCCFLVDLNPSDIEDPLAQFNHTFPSKDGLLGLVETINNALGANALDHRILEQVFGTYWPQFNDRFQAILNEHPPEAVSPPRDERDLLSEILENTRMLSSRIGRLERDYDSLSSSSMSLSPKASRPNVRAASRPAVRILARHWLSQGETHEAIVQRLQGCGLSLSEAYRLLASVNGSAEVSGDSTSSSNSSDSS